MYFGALFPPNKPSEFDDHQLLMVSNLINWGTCSEQKSSADGYAIHFLTDNHLPQIKIESRSYTNSEFGVLVLFEGSIYNKFELIKTLKLNDIELESPQLVFEAFQQWGPSFANNLNGDFAICIYNYKKQEAFFYRDHIGIIPLAVSKIDETIYFATDPMGLDQALYGHKKIDQAYLQSRFFNWEYDYYISPHKEVQTVKPGHYLHIAEKNITQIKYWFPESIQTDHHLTQEKVVNDLSIILKDAITARSDRSYTAGSHLSGGLDSGIVSALARINYAEQPDFFGFSWSPKRSTKSNEISFDERDLIQETAVKNNITPVFSNINIKDYASFVSDWRYQGELLYESKTVQEAKKRGANLIFSGWGGDDFISIGNRGIDSDLIRQFNLHHFIRKYPLSKPKVILSTLFHRVLFPTIRWNYVNHKVDPAIYPYIKDVIGKNRIPRRKRFDFSSRRKVHLQLIELGHLGARTAEWYVHGQRNGVEYRYPLLDKRIIEYMIKVPSKCLVGNNHYRILLREIGKEVLPNNVLKNNSKDDPLRSEELNVFSNQLKKELINEFDDFRNNPDLNFIDFDLLEKDIPQLLKSIESVKEENATIFFYLKYAHELTKGLCLNKV